MTHQPKTLALLISLIGAGASPAAHALSALEPPAITALDLTRWSPGLVWRSDEDSVLRVQSPAQLEEIDPPVARDNIPVQEHPGIAEVFPDGEVHSPPPRIESKPKAVKRVAAKTPAPSTAHAAHTVRAPAAATMRFSAGVAAPDEANLTSIHAEWLTQSLAAILPDGITGLPAEEMLARVARRFPAAVAMPPEASLQAWRGVLRRDAALLALQRRDIVVTSQTDKVLRNLHGVLAPAQEVQTQTADSEDMVVTTHAEKVLATLMELTRERRAHEIRAKHEARRAAKAAATAAVLRAEAARQAPPQDPGLLQDRRRAAKAVELDIDLSALPALAEPAASVREAPLANPFGGERIAVADSSLEQVRGGFVTESLNISFGIERAAYVNGVLVTSTSLNVSDLGRVTARGTTSLDSGTLALVQSGAGNMVSAGSISPGSIGAVVQNTLDGQKIQNVTVINATVNSLGILRGLNLESSLRGAVLDSLRR
jgi:hypothetical protein